MTRDPLWAGPALVFGAADRDAARAALADLLRFGGECQPYDDGETRDEGYCSRHGVNMDECPWARARAAATAVNQ